MIENLKQLITEYSAGYEAVLIVITLIVLLAALYVITKK